jgi:hypothetical protein
MFLGILFSGVFITDNYMFVMDLLSVTKCFGNHVFYIVFGKMFCGLWKTSGVYSVVFISKNFQ